uniref:1,3,6,7-tetrahydroxyxanthone 8-prenyltransferase n=1 Tax=Hypericum calycinum TaxID=55963 RepID=A0A3S8RK07_9ROSI|nr:1,3,6,7-tetrahydroxyxanthone 8-prenyltransferase [Hypericum calycinum]
MDNLSLSLPTKYLQVPAQLRNPNVFAHPKKLTANATKLSDMSAKCSQTFLPARSPYCLDTSHDSSRAFLFRAKAKQVGETSEFAPGRKLNYIDVLVKFLRPYSMIGIFMSCMAYLLRTCMESPELLKWSLLPKAVATLVAVLSTSAFNSGFNQLHDIEIDRINKPDLVLSSGELPLELAWLLVTSYVIIGILASAFVQSKVLIACICIKFFSIYIYNAPPIRLKRTSAGAIFSASLWVLTTNFAAYGAARHILGLPFQLSLPVIFIATFTTVFHATFGILKDLPDVDGDRKFGVITLAVLFGKRTAALLGFGILMHNYAFAIIMAIKYPQVFRQAVMIPAHIVMACILAYQVWKLEKANYNKEDSQVFYKFMWKLLDAEWAIFPFI